MTQANPLPGFMATGFKSTDFTATKWDTADQKARFANHFVRFVASGFKETLFHDWFYKRLSMTFGHIAHYNRGGFFSTFFESTQGKVDFLHQTLNPWTGFVGDPAFTYCDVERAIATWLETSGYPSLWADRLARETEQTELTQLARLRAKYPQA